MFYPVYFNLISKEVNLKGSDTGDVITIYPKLSDNSEGCWRWGMDTFNEKKSKLEIKLVSGRQEYDVFEKVYLESDGDIKTTKMKSYLLNPEYTSDTATTEFKSIIPGNVFNSPKSISLLRDLIRVSNCEDDDIVLDFFAGSGTTAHAVMILNIEDKIDRRYIMVQIPELCDEKSEAFKAGFKTISEISKERIRRASNKIKTELLQKEDDSKIKFDDENKHDLDLGFRVFKQSKSNYKKWLDYDGQDSEQLESLFDTFESALEEEWNPDNLLFEIILIEGFPLDSKIVREGSFIHNEVLYVFSDFCGHSLFVCLDKEINSATIDSLVLGDNDIFICLDTAVSDQDKARLSDKGLIKTI